VTLQTAEVAVTAGVAVQGMSVAVGGSGVKVGGGVKDGMGVLLGASVLVGTTGVAVGALAVRPATTVLAASFATASRVGWRSIVGMIVGCAGALHPESISIAANTSAAILHDR
jgi:hypothetical protein